MRPQTQPLLLLSGERGSGKTHLLRAIVHRVRRRQVPAAIAAISDMRFPSEVRALANDSGPIDALPFAILLIDGLGRMAKDYDALTKLMETFLDREFPVVVTLEGPPCETPPMPDALKALLDTGRCVTLGSRRTAVSGVAPNLDPKDREIAQLRANLIQSRTENTVSHQAARGLLERAEVLVRELERNKTDLADAKRSQQARLQDIQEFESKLAALQIGPAPSDTPELGDTDSDIEQLRARFAEDRQALRQSFQETHEHFDAEIEDVRNELKRTQEERQRFESQAGQLRNETDLLKKVLVDVRAEREMTKARLKRANDALALREPKDGKVDENSDDLPEADLDETLAMPQSENAVGVESSESLQAGLSNSLKILEGSVNPSTVETESSEGTSDTKQNQGEGEHETAAETEPEDSPPSLDSSHSPSDELPSIKPKMSLHHVEQLDDTLDIFSDDDV